MRNLSDWPVAGDFAPRQGADMLRLLVEGHASGAPGEVARALHEIVCLRIPLGVHRFVARNTCSLLSNAPVAAARPVKLCARVPVERALLCLCERKEACGALGGPLEHWLPRVASGRTAEQGAVRASVCCGSMKPGSRKAQDTPPTQTPWLCHGSSLIAAGFGQKMNASGTGLTIQFHTTAGRDEHARHTASAVAGFVHSARHRFGAPARTRVCTRTPLVCHARLLCQPRTAR